MKRKRWLIPLIIAAVLIIYCLVTYLVTPHLIIRPTYNEEAASELNMIELSELFLEERPMNVPLVEDVKISTSYGDLRGWRLHQSSNTYEGSYDLLLYFGGYNEDSATAALRFLNQMTDTDTFTGYDIAVVDWPGFGISEGKPTDQAIRDTSASIYRYFTAKKDIRKIYLMGYSFGTGPAAYVASLYDVDGLILIAPYESAFDLYNSKTPVFYGPMRWLISFYMDEGRYAEDVSVSPLLIISDADTIIPNKYSLRLQEHFQNGADLVTVPGVSHGDLTGNSAVLEAISGYLQK
ncbi:MAG: alpha/beta fold hydrolase [Lachnospiraceae bacterium]|nr:alpha/beta fold hydrolase [Lachnospiraceae bacterium]